MLPARRGNECQSPAPAGDARPSVGPAGSRLHVRWPGHGNECRLSAEEMNACCLPLQVKHVHLRAPPGTGDTSDGRPADTLPARAGGTSEGQGYGNECGLPAAEMNAACPPLGGPRSSGCVARHLLATPPLWWGPLGRSANGGPGPPATPPPLPERRRRYQNANDAAAAAAAAADRIAAAAPPPPPRRRRRSSAPEIRRPVPSSRVLVQKPECGQGHRARMRPRTGGHPGCRRDPPSAWHLVSPKRSLRAGRP